MLQIHVAIFFPPHKMLRTDKAAPGRSRSVPEPDQHQPREALPRIKGLHCGSRSKWWGMGKFGVLPPPHGPKSACNFRLPQNLTTNSLLLTEALPVSNVNSQSTRTLHTVCIIHYIQQSSRRKENHKEKIYSIYGKMSPLSGPLQPERMSRVNCSLKHILP